MHPSPTSSPFIGTDLSFTFSSYILSRGPFYSTYLYSGFCSLFLHRCVIQLHFHDRHEDTEYQPSSPLEMSIASTAPSPPYSTTSSQCSTPLIRTKALQRLPAGNSSHYSACSTNYNSYTSNISYEYLDEPNASSKRDTVLPSRHINTRTTFYKFLLVAGSGSGAQ